jgi:hypothetical protein
LKSFGIASKIDILSVGLESVDLELVCFDESNLGHPVANVLALISLKLKDLAVFRVLYDGSIASKLLKKK